MSIAYCWWLIRLTKASAQALYLGGVGLFRTVRNCSYPRVWTVQDCFSWACAFAGWMSHLSVWHWEYKNKYIFLYIYLYFLYLKLKLRNVFKTAKPTQTSWTCVIKTYIKRWRVNHANFVLVQSRVLRSFRLSGIFCFCAYCPAQFLNCFIFC